MILEVCIDSLESARNAHAGGADRIEICSALSVGGLTPAGGLVRACLELQGLASAVMIRPHEGGFCYGEDDLRVMRHDIEFAKEAGADAVVFGVLQEDGQIDSTACRRLLELARPLEVTFHRAFDLTPDPLRALDELMELGFDRLLTSGQAGTASGGADTISHLVARAGDEIRVMAGAGIRPDNVNALIERTNVREIHASASRAAPPQDHPGAVAFGGARRRTEVDFVRRLRANIDAS